MCERNIMAVKKHKIRSACNMYLSEKVYIVICQPCQAHLVKKKQNFNGKCKVERYFRLDVTVIISKRQYISKQNCRVVFSPKKQTNQYDFLS